MNVGNVVVLKSGGPKMTIESIEDDCAECTWFNEKKELTRATFDLNTIQVVKGLTKENLEKYGKFIL